MNKLLILIAAFLFLFNLSHAQTEKGSQTLGADVSLMYNKTNGVNVDTYDNSSTIWNSKTTNSNIGPNYSYFIADKLDIGASIAYGSFLTDNSGSDDNSTKQSNKNYGGTICLRKYFMYKDKIGFRAGPFVTYQKQDLQNTYTGELSPSSYNSKSDIWNAGINLDLIYYPSKKIGISAVIANLNYEFDKTNEGNHGSSSDNGANFNFINDGLSLSVFYVFGVK